VRADRRRIVRAGNLIPQRERVEVMLAPAQNATAVVLLMVGRSFALERVMPAPRG
jgi:hypothetical protein